MTTQHTPGPWIVYDDSNDGKTNRIEIAARGKTVAHIYHSVPEEDLPNANLIAAAPDLLEELKKMCRAYVNLLEGGRDRIVQLGGDCDPVDVMESASPNLREARAAIAKATGQE